MGQPFLLFYIQKILVDSFVAPMLEGSFGFNYPKETSNTIIMLNPIIKAQVVSLICPRSCEPGIASFATTKIIAPAAKLNAYGTKGSITTTAQAPSKAATGSTNPENCP